MVNTTSHGNPEVPAVFPDWSPYRDLAEATRAYLRDPDLALAALDAVLSRKEVAGFTLERFVNDANGVWQEVAVCDSSRLVLWHGEDLAPDDGPPGAMSSSLRVIPLSSVTEVGCRRRLVRDPQGPPRVDSVDVYVLLTALDEGMPGGLSDPPGGLRHDALRFGKTFDEGGPGQIARVEEFAELIAGLVGRPRP
jgi:hypothetical protein